jgi:hypothetical protein
MGRKSFTQELKGLATASERGTAGGRGESGGHDDALGSSPRPHSEVPPTSGRDGSRRRLAGA